MNKNLQESIEKGIQEYDKITKRNNQLIAGLVNLTKILVLLKKFLTSSTTKTKVNLD